MRAGFLDHVIFPDSAVAQQTPPNVVLGGVCPSEHHFVDVRGNLHSKTIIVRFDGESIWMYRAGA
ncbi:hypothetical protein [Edaphobacter sp. HDX4]|uniref:hypothetical protein n=1 Tax=Edaphobacter sp. HDX4 TaxID=2794064 RepID=UPI002FE50C7F